MFNYLKELQTYLFTNEMNTFYFDFETTGLNQYHDHIIDFCFLKEPKTTTPSDTVFETDEYCFQALVNPEQKLSAKITEITSITNEMLKDKPTIEHFIHSIEKYINNKNTISYMIAHNCHGFDQIFLENAFRNNGIQPKQSNLKYIDTLLLAKKISPNMFSYSLKTLCKYYQIQEGSHRAFSDCIALRKVYIKLLEKLNREHFKNTYSINYLLKNPYIVFDFLYYN